MKFYANITVVAVAIGLAACQQPTTYGPQVTREELAAEEATQRDMSAQKELELNHKREEKRLAMEQRLLKVSKPVAEAGAELCVKIRPTGTNCVFDIAMEKFDVKAIEAYERGGAVNAYADGERIFVTPGMMRFIKSDEELALVLSHELAHNIMGHIDSTRVNAIAGSVVGLVFDVAAASQGIDTQGGFMRTGGNIGAASFSPSFEKEADYVGLYILTNSGYKTDRAANFWRRFSVQDERGIEGSMTHPSNPERFVAMQKTIDEINYKRKRRLPLVPDFKEEVTNN